MGYSCSAEWIVNLLYEWPGCLVHLGCYTMTAWTLKLFFSKGVGVSGCVSVNSHNILFNECQFVMLFYS